MTMARRALKSLLTVAALTCAFAVTAAPAHAQIRRSILERYEDMTALHGRLSGFQANADFHVSDLEQCRDTDPVNGGSRTWLVAIFDSSPRPQLTAGFDAFIEPSTQTAFNAEVARLEGQGWFIDDMDVAAAGSLGAAPRLVAVLNEQQGSRQNIINANNFEAFQAAWHAQQAAGMRIADLDVSNVFGQPRYHAVMRPGDVDERLIHETNLATFQSTRAAMEGRGWRVREIAMQQGIYMAVLNPGSGPSSTQVFQDWPSLLQAWSAIDRNQRINTRIKDVECWMEGGQARYAALFRGTGRVRRPNTADTEGQTRSPGRSPN